LVTAFETNRFQKIPVGRIIRFAVATAMRQDEISRIEWADFTRRKDVPCRRRAVTSKSKTFTFTTLDTKAQAASSKAGFSIEQVTLVTGHKDWKMLRRYTHLKPEALHNARAREAA
jgi:integrase